ncbi:MAG: PIG-L family deacetylase [Chloroflexi bacterium]|nr:PIG-L family deacetylase [Chloroflexota bacterium]
MAEPLRLMCILAHPDDETLGFGATLAKYAAEGVETYLITATRGERGWHRDPSDNPGMDALGQIREKELRTAAECLNIGDICLLDYIDGDLDQADPPEAIARIAAYVRQVRPQVVLTFAPDGAYGHPDHIAISQFTSAALVAAADTSFPIPHPPHRVSKLYYHIVTQELVDVYLSVFDDIVMMVDGVERRAVIWPDWAVTTRIDGSDYAEDVMKAVKCHQTQIPADDGFLARLSENAVALCRMQHYMRVYSLVNGGREPEDDLFAGIT